MKTTNRIRRETTPGAKHVKGKSVDADLIETQEKLDFLRDHAPESYAAANEVLTAFYEQLKPPTVPKQIEAPDQKSTDVKVDFSPDQLTRIEAAAKCLGVSEAQFIQEAVVTQLPDIERYGRVPTAPGLKRMEDTCCEAIAMMSTLLERYAKLREPSGGSSWDSEHTGLIIIVCGIERRLQEDFRAAWENKFPSASVPHG